MNCKVSESSDILISFHLFIFKLETNSSFLAFSCFGVMCVTCFHGIVMLCIFLMKLCLK